MDNIRQEYRMLRFLKGISISEIARYMGCTYSLISNWEHDRGYMCKEKTRKYIDYIESH